MELNGFTRPSEIYEGGVSAVYLADVSEVASCRFDSEAGVYTGITFRAGAAFSEFQIREERASYRQSVSGLPPVARVVHELSFSLAGTAEDATAALGSLYGAGKGLVAVVCVRGGGNCLVGWSPLWEQECPLRPVYLRWDSGARFEDDPSCTVTLRSEDTSFSKQFTGGIPVIGGNPPTR